MKYVVANGGEIPNRGEWTLAFKTETGQPRRITFQNAEVGMPIISTNGLTAEQNEVTYRYEDGYILHVPTGERTPFIARNGVYVLQMRVPRRLVGDQSAGFHRRG